MQITELLRLTKWFNEEIVAMGIPSKYNALFNKMNNNVNNQKQPFDKDKQALFDSLKSINLNSLTLEQLKFLEQLDVLDLLGEGGLNNIISILYENNLDIATAAKKMGEFSTRINNAQTTLNEIDTTLKKSFSIDDDSEIPEDSVMMRIYFQDKVAINDLKDLKRLSTTWYDIGRGIAMAQDMSPEDFTIIGAQKGSFNS